MYLSPRRLRPHDKVAIVAPASPIMADEVQCGIDIIRECGLEPVLGPCVKNLRTTTDHSAPLQERVSELNWAFSDPKIKAVIGAVGGVGSAAVLPYLDYDKIRSSRKTFLGMSDLTSINCALLVKSGLISICGQTPSIRLNEGRSIMDADSQSFQHTLQLLMSTENWGDRPFAHNPFFPRTVSPGKTSGYAIGCNSDTFMHLFGTDYLPELSNSILFVEDVHKGGESITRQFVHLQLAGVMKQMNGVVFGEFVDVPQRVAPKIPSIDDVIVEFFGNCGLPCSYGYNFSHGPHTAPIPIGATCHMDADTGDVSFDFCMSQ